MATKNLYKRLATDATAEENGTPVDFGQGLVLRIRSVRSSVVKTLEAQIARENRKYFRSGDGVPQDTLDAQNCRRAAALISEFISGVTDEDGNTLTYSPVNALKIVTDLVELREMVIGAAAMHDTFRAEELKGVTANLSPASASSSITPAAGAQTE